MANPFFSKLLHSLDRSRLTPELNEWAAEELVYFDCNPDDAEYFLHALDVSTSMPAKPPNENDSTLAYLAGITDQKPKSGIKRTPISPPDFDFDTNARPQIKKYLVEKYGINHVALLPVYLTLKTKLAIKDAIKYLIPTMTPDEQNAITKKFILNRNDFDSEIAYFLASLENDPFLTKWFKDDHPPVFEAVQALLGTARSSGIHAGGIILSSADIKSFCAMTWDAEEGMYVTQPEMNSVESLGLIKNDFLGLSTIDDIMRCFRLIEERHGEKFTFSDIPKNDPQVLAEFGKGNTLSVFQFDTPLATDKIKQIRIVKGISTLSAITSVARRGPLKLGMDKVLIRRSNGDEPTTYLEPSLEPILKDTFGVILYQEQVMSICKALGSFSGDEALDVMKAMGKKKKSVIDSYEAKFLASCEQKKINRKIAKEIWDLMAAFAEYGFNKSHAVAYSTVSYLCMWLHYHYKVEWETAVLMGAKKENFKAFFASWKDSIVKPNINLSKSSYYIDASNRTIMPLSAVNGVNGSFIEGITSLQPVESFEDYYQRGAEKALKLQDEVKKLKKIFKEMPMNDERIRLEELCERMNAKKSLANKAISGGVLECIILSGCFDLFKPAEQHDAVYRKVLIAKMVEMKHRLLKPSKKEREADLEMVASFEKLPKKDFLFEELRLLNFTGFDYFEFFGQTIHDRAETHMQMPLLTPEEALERSDGQLVTVAGAVESISFFPTKSGKNKGREMCKIKLSHNASTIEVTVFPDTLDKDDAHEKTLRKLRELHPFIVKGKLNLFNDQLSIIYQKGLNLAF